MIGDNDKSLKHGFTLVELLITSFVFSVIFGVATATFVGAIRIQKYNMSNQQILDQTSYSLEYIARALRMAKVDKDNSCGNGAGMSYAVSGNRVEFLNYEGKCEEFFLESDQVKVSGGNFTGVVPLTSSGYSVNNLNFSTTGNGPGDDLQPRITIFMEIEDNRLKDKPKIDIQTTVSQRNLDE